LKSLPSEQDQSSAALPSEHATSYIQSQVIPTTLVKWQEIAVSREINYKMRFVVLLMQCCKRGI